MNAGSTVFYFIDYLFINSYGSVVSMLTHSIVCPLHFFLMESNSFFTMFHQFFYSHTSQSFIKIS